ncbi:sensor histidine kinase [Micromonospora cathayae]|uniref:Oxygen sensor histidine kinase NreB n=1 Tax=Micromonospora cathayae TaxID=3028804 RepID=A0ABY7ZRL1_9ACTN|nr:sensor histidine kinase [Micromonospora sp. HUAS 3]WDZ85530.1 sensor histidine kinase [Micromonospora sp. HUAS 3]
MSGTAERVDRLAAWEDREADLYRLLPYVGLAAATVLALAAPMEHAPPTPVVLALAAAAGAWVAWFITLHPGWVSRRALMAAYYLGLLGFSAALVLISPWYGFFAWIGFLHAFLVLPGRWRFAGIAATATLVATAQSAGLPGSPTHWLLWSVLALFNLGAAGAVSWFGAVTGDQNANRKRLVAILATTNADLAAANGRLAEANRRLAETMRENEQLHAELLVRAREAGVLDERQRMAREIHDTLAQGLAGIITQLEAAEQARDRVADWRRHVRTAVELGRESLAEARRSVRAVRPERLETTRLPEALTELVASWSTRTGIRGEAHTTGTPRPLHPEVEVTLLRAAQEALANAAKHAHPARVGLTLSYMADVVTLDVRDDGTGFDPTALPDRPGSGEGGYGLAAMRQRVTGVGGHLAVESEPGGGTAVSATVPAVPAQPTVPAEPAQPTVPPLPALPTVAVTGDGGVG